MNKLLFIGFLFLLFSCKDIIKNEEKLLVDNTFEDIQFAKPEITTSNIITTENDFLGYWVGNFEANISEEEKDSLRTNNLYNLLNRKITFSFDEIVNDSVFGHTIVAGNISSFKGTISNYEYTFAVNLEETSNTNFDGSFNMTISKRDSIINGFWVANHPMEVKVARRKYKLNKKKFIYLATNKLDITFINDEKSNAYKYSDTIDGKVEEYEDYEYYTNTEKLFEKNASLEELETEFVSNLSKADIFILRNSIFARHGFAFRDKQLRMYFEDYDWYMPVFGDVKEDLTDIEIKNIELLLRYEQNAIEYYDTFGR